MIPVRELSGSTKQKVLPSPDRVSPESSLEGGGEGIGDEMEKEITPGEVPPCCEDCLYWACDKERNPDDGECRRRAPPVQQPLAPVGSSWELHREVATEWLWPVTCGYHWCGDGKRRWTPDEEFDSNR